MSWEIVVLVALLGFLCVRNEYIRRPWLFVLAIIAWGAARLLMELNFVNQSYAWGSMKSVGVAVSLFLCLLFVFAACYRPKKWCGRPHTKDESPRAQKDEKDDTGGAPTDPNRRIQDILSR